MTSVPAVSFPFLLFTFDLGYFKSEPDFVAVSFVVVIYLFIYSQLLDQMLNFWQRKPD